MKNPKTSQESLRDSFARFFALQDQIIAEIARKYKGHDFMTGFLTGFALVARNVKSLQTLLVRTGVVDAADLLKYSADGFQDWLRENAPKDRQSIDEELYQHYLKLASDIDENENEDRGILDEYLDKL